jgi:hypothetical protein
MQFHLMQSATVWYRQTPPFAFLATTLASHTRNRSIMVIGEFGICSCRWGSDKDTSYASSAASIHSPFDPTSSSQTFPYPSSTSAFCHRPNTFSLVHFMLLSSLRPLLFKFQAHALYSVVRYLQEWGADAPSISIAQRLADNYGPTNFKMVTTRQESLRKFRKRIYDKWVKRTK